MELNCSEVTIDADEITIMELLSIVEKKINNKILDQLTNDKGDLTRGTIILLNGRNIVHLDKLSTIGQSGDLIDIFPPGGGG